MSPFRLRKPLLYLSKQENFMCAEKSNELKAAEWLVVGFVKNWDWWVFDKMIFDATGKHVRDFTFLPDSYCWSGKAQVRAYIAQNWPKLFAFLNAASAEKQIKAAEQIVKLKWNGNRPLGCLSGTERDEMVATKRQLRIATTSQMHSRSTFKKHSAAQWNVCS